MQNIYKKILDGKNSQNLVEIFKIEEYLSNLKITFLENDGYKKTNVIEDLVNLKMDSRFRAMTHKTQVVTKDEEYFVTMLRDRLTHSLEVSAISQLIADKFNKNLLELFKEKLFEKFKSDDNNLNEYLKERLKELFKDDIEIINLKVIEYISLVHDIGHPPFGHLGEKELHKYLIEKFNIPFEGNANNTAILMKEKLDNYSRYSYGIIKYPWILDKNNKQGIYEEHFPKMNKMIKSIEQKDISFFQQFGLKYEKIPNIHMLIMEQADDLAYLTSDMEDAILNFDIIFNPKHLLGENKILKGIESVENKEIEIMLKALIREQTKESDFSTNEIKNIIKKLRNYFLDNIYINKNTLSIEFKDKSIKPFLNNLRIISEELYYNPVKKQEYKKVISSIIEKLTDNRNNKDFLLKVIPSQETKLNILKDFDDEIKKIKHIRNFVATLTDNFAINYDITLTKELDNIKISNSKKTINVEYNL